jgi:predicted nucleotidyltransferase
MIDRLKAVLEADPRVTYALVFGSAATGRVRADSDVDVAIGLAEGAGLTPLEIGALVARLEEAAGRPIDLVLLDEAPPGLAYRVFRDGRPMTVRSESALKARFVRAVLEYLDFKPFEELFTRGALEAATRGSVGGDGR